MGFSDITFGFASAEVESSEDPDLLLRAFLDPYDTINELRDTRRFLVLGPKGSGKSAAGLHLSLLADIDPLLFVTPHFLADLSYRRLEQIVRADIEPALVYPKAWSWILLLCMVSSVAQDEGVYAEDAYAYQRTLNALRLHKLIPARTIEDLVGRSTVSDLHLKVFNVELSKSSHDLNADIPLVIMAHQLRELLGGLETVSTHIIVIDGLDDILLDDKAQFNALAGLVLEASRLNQFFREKRLPFKIVILCRTELYERLPGPNQNKLRQDLGVELSWYHGSDRPRRSNLVRLANLRAKLYDDSLEDVIDELLPRQLGRSGTHGYLLSHTRHTPRDFVQVLRYIQMTAGLDKPDRYHVRAGLRSYAESYFLPEIRDELQGMAHSGAVSQFLEHVRRLRKTEFTFSEVESGMPPDLKGSELEKLLAAVYLTGAIGNCYREKEGILRYNFRFMNRSSVLIPVEPIVLHKALAKALMVPQADD